MKTPGSCELDVLDSHNAGFRVEFSWRGDRYGHRILGVWADRTIPLLESVEGDEKNSWPPSPPFQQVHRELRPGEGVGAVLLATGMADGSFWSGSFFGTRDIRWALLQISVACRFKKPPIWLGITYQVKEGISASQSSEDFGITLRTEKDEIVFSIGSAPIETCLATESIPTSSVKLSGDRVYVAARETPHMTTATTNQWAYSLQFRRPYWVK
jgi:hypothetical protein